jgi:hypothetical protein
MTPLYNGPEDRRYQFVTCPACRHPWQLIDYRCALHLLTCPAPYPTPTP